MRIVIDLQGAQSIGSRIRGIGRYSRALSQAIVRNKGKHEVILALSGLFPETIEPIRADFDSLLPQENIRVWYAPGLVSKLAENDWQRKSAELVRESFLASLNPDMVLITSLFEGLSDDAVSSIGMLSLNIPTATILYDLIPYIYRDTYLKSPAIETWYETKLDHLRRSDLFLAISESSRQEGMHYLGFPDDISINISTAADAQFRPQSIDGEQEAEIRERYKIHHPYVMYTGGIDYRKNIEGLIRAYANLSQELRAEHQLALVCSIQPPDQVRLEELAKQQGLKKSEIVFTGFISDEDLLVLYSLCKLFVFPSLHEGFGLPVLEAMSCGRAVIGANSSSVPEVIGREDALFDPRNDGAITAKLKQVLTDDDFRGELERHGLEQARKFSWDRSAILAIAALEQFHIKNQRRISLKQSFYHRPRLAYISPLPPERSGISDYSSELLPELSRYYDIDVIVDQDSVCAPWINANCKIRKVEWFRAHASRYDRILYHFGNSFFHKHMFSLLEEIPGVIVLHDFFLSGIMSQMDGHSTTPNRWINELYKAHGYKAIQDCSHTLDTAEVVWKYPCNLSVLREAQGIIVHSENSRRLAKQWYSSNDADNWSVIPLLRASLPESDRAQARDTLSLKADDFVICSFGLLGSTKLNHRLLEAWLTSKLTRDNNCVLVFVGANDEGEYGKELLQNIRDSGLSKRIRITGWADAKSFRDYLVAADIGVQLRTLSRGETSAAVLDCMNYGLATIVNANGSMADLSDNAVCKLPDDFSDKQLINALENLWCNKPHREQLGARAREIILKHHAPRTCADQYFSAIENFYRNAAADIHSLTDTISKIEPVPANPEVFLPLSESIAKSILPRFFSRQLLVDVSGLVMGDRKDNAQPEMQKILYELLANSSGSLRVEPVYATADQGYRYARSFTLEFLGCSADILNDEPIEYQVGDIFLGLDLQPQVVVLQQDFYQKMRCHGVQVQFMVYDLLPVLMPQNYTKSAVGEYNRWLDIIVKNDGAVCISKTVADELDTWVKKHDQERLRPFNISWFHLGTDVDASISGSNTAAGIDAVMGMMLGYVGR